jgi:thiamine-phosphate pyrophosphorylase
MLHRIHRTIDANLNRVCEGLRVLEDIARFIMGDKDISRELKSVRHYFSKLAKSDTPYLIESRDVDGDIGAEHDLTNLHQDLDAVVHANAKRVQEGIRVLEELFKLPDVNELCPFSELRRQRYAVYSLEKRLITLLNIESRQEGGLKVKTDDKTGKSRKKAG